MKPQQNEKTQIQTPLKNQTGSTLLYAALSLVFIAVMGLTVIDVGATDNEDSANAVDLAKAEFEAVAGLEWAKWNWSQGLPVDTGSTIHLQGLLDTSPDLTMGFNPLFSVAPGSDSPDSLAEAAPATDTIRFGTPIEDAGGQVVVVPVARGFADGTFLVTRDAETGDTTSTGRNGIAKAVHTMTLAATENCFEFLDGAGFDFPTTGSGTMSDVHFHKLDETTDGAECMDQLIMTSVILSWSEAEAGEQVVTWTVAGNILYDAAGGIGSPQAGAGSGVIVDIEDDFVISDNHNHKFNSIGLSYPVGTQPVSPQTFTVTAYFADGGSKTHSYVYDIADEEDSLNDDDGSDQDDDNLNDDDESDLNGGGEDDPSADADTDGDDGDLLPRDPIDLDFIPREPSMEAHVSFNYILKDNTQFSDGVSPILSDQDDNGRWPCDTCEGSLRIYFLDRSSNEIYSGLCNLDDAAPTGGSWVSGYAHQCEFHFDVADIDDIEKIEFAGRSGLSIKITEFYVSLDHETDGLFRQGYDPNATPCIYGVDTGIIPGETTSSGAVDTGSMDYSFSNPMHMCDVENWGYVRSVTYSL